MRHAKGCRLSINPLQRPCARHAGPMRQHIGCRSAGFHAQLVKILLLRRCQAPDLAVTVAGGGVCRGAAAAPEGADAGRVNSVGARGGGAQPGGRLTAVHQHLLRRAGPAAGSAPGKRRVHRRAHDRRGSPAGAGPPAWTLTLFLVVIHL